VQGVRIDEAEINPLFVRAEGVVGVDCVLRLRASPDAASSTKISETSEIEHEFHPHP